MTWLIANWKLALIAILLASNALFFKLWRGEVEDFSFFRAQVQAIGEQAAKEARAKESADKLRKEQADAENKRTTAALQSDLDRLRRANSGKGGLSGPAPSAGSPDRTCLDPAKLDSALRSLDAGILGIVEIGSQAVIDLDSAKAWAQSQPVK